MNKTFDYDVLVIGLGPAGMAVSIMAHKMGLKVCAIEKNKIGGECLNVGCIPSKALLKSAHARHFVGSFKNLGLSAVSTPEVGDVFARVREVVQEVNEGKTAKMFKAIDMLLGKGAARFIDAHTVEVPGERKITARKIFICAGTKPALPPISGLSSVPVLTNENLFELSSVPKSIAVIGGGAIGCEMGQALARLGSKVSIFNADPFLIPRGEAEAGELLRKQFELEGIQVFNSCKIKNISEQSGNIVLQIEGAADLVAEKLLVAAGRSFVLSDMGLENAGVKFDMRKGIEVDAYLRTSQKHIFAVGDCNGFRQFTHAAMHQGMLALINCFLPWPLKRRYQDYVVPWSVFTDPEVSQVGFTETELKMRGINYQTIRVEYADYGRATADGNELGYIKAYCSKLGKIYGVSIVGQESSEMIQEFAMLIQLGKRLPSLLFLQHSFPNFSFMNKRIAENWMMDLVKASWVQGIARAIFRC